MRVDWVSTRYPRRFAFVSDDDGNPQAPTDRLIIVAPRTHSRNAQVRSAEASASEAFASAGRRWLPQTSKLRLAHAAPARASGIAADLHRRDLRGHLRDHPVHWVSPLERVSIFRACGNPLVRRVDEQPSSEHRNVCALFLLLQCALRGRSTCCGPRTAPRTQRWM